MGYWGEYLFQSDTDYDAIDDLSDMIGIKLHFWGWRDDEGEVDENDGAKAKDPEKEAALQQEHMEKARSILNGGKFDEVFNKLKGSRPQAKFEVVILTALAMEAGANISDEQRSFVKRIYKKNAGLEGAVTQVCGFGVYSRYSNATR